MHALLDISVLTFIASIELPECQMYYICIFIEKYNVTHISMQHFNDIQKTNLMLKISGLVQ